MKCMCPPSEQDVCEVAGIGDVHLHQTHHTFARWVSESTRSIIETQEELSHKHAATTRGNVQRVAVQSSSSWAIKRDKHSTSVLDWTDEIIGQHTLGFFLISAA